MNSHSKGFLGAPCTVFGVLPGPHPALLCFPLHQGTILLSQAAGAVAGLVDTSAGDKGTAWPSLCLCHLPYIPEGLGPSA